MVPAFLGGDGGGGVGDGVGVQLTGTDEVRGENETR